MSNEITTRPSARLSDTNKENIVFSICLVCMFLFLYTAYSKTLDHQRFLNGLKRFKVFGGLATYISWLVPISEYLISVLLIIPKTAIRGLYAFVGLMIVFTVYIISVLIWARNHLPCHCGGAIEKLTWSQHLWFNLAFISIASFALWLNKSKI